MVTNSLAALRAAIDALESQRGMLGDAVVDVALAPLRARLAALVPLGAPEQQLRQVSVLFLDMVGSTQLAGKLDPETVHDVLDGALQQLSAVVREHGGEVLQYAGDNLMAAFGASGAREDDTERAVRCGLAMLAEGTRLGEEVKLAHGHVGFGVRVGIHTGTVLRGGGVDGDNTLRGQAVHIAARMEQSAPPGGLRISHDTWSLVRGLFDAQSQDPISVKGVEAPMRSWLVERLKPRQLRLPARGIEGQETPLVGRSDELARLLRSFEVVCETGSPRYLTVLADPGLGKSRLLQELQHQLATHTRSAWLLLARMQPASSLQPYGLLRELLAWRLSIADSDSAEVARSKLVEGLSPWLNDPQDPPAAALGQLVGLDFADDPKLVGLRNDARLLRDRALAAMALWLRRLSASDGSPVVLLLDDVQWADDASLDALQQLFNQAAGWPLLVVIGARPQLVERRPAWGQGLPRHELLSLQPLADAQREELTRALLRHLPVVPPALTTLIDDQAEGNPFYAEEIIRMLIDDGAIVVTEADWKVDEPRLGAARVPPTLTGVLQARIDALSEAQRRALQSASIVGPVFWDDALAHLRADAEREVPALVQRGMVQPRPTSAFEGSVEESFHHHLLHQVSYDTVLPSVRREGHARAAAWLADRVGDRAAEYLAVTADHYERAGDFARAFDWFKRAARHASKRHANALAELYCQRALQLPFEPDARLRFELQMIRTRTADVVGDRAIQQAAYDDGWRIAQSLNDDRLRAEVLSGRALLADRLGDYAGALPLAEAAVQASERCDDALHAALSWGEVAWLAIVRRDFERARFAVQTGLRWARLTAERGGGSSQGAYEVQLLLVAVELYSKTHDSAARVRTLSEASLKAAACGEVRLEALCEGALADCAFEHADFAAVRLHADNCLRLASSIGLLDQSAQAHKAASLLALAEGDAAQALERAEQAMSQYLRIGHRANFAAVRAVKAWVLAEAGEHDAARAEWAALEVDFAERGEAPNALAARLRQAEAQAARGELAPALQTVLRELPSMTQPGSLDAGVQPLATRLAVHKVLAAAGHEQARAQIELAHAELMQQVQGLASPADRERVLGTVKLHREIVQRWSEGSTA
jgi:class 3 adenylate cyclase